MLLTAAHLPADTETLAARPWQQQRPQPPAPLPCQPPNCRAIVNPPSNCIRVAPSTLARTTAARVAAQKTGPQWRTRRASAQPPRASSPARSAAKVWGAPVAWIRQVHRSPNSRPPARRSVHRCASGVQSVAQLQCGGAGKQQRRGRPEPAGSAVHQPCAGRCCRAAARRAVAGAGQQGAVKRLGAGAARGIEQRSVQAEARRRAHAVAHRRPSSGAVAASSS